MVNDYRDIRPSGLGIFFRTCSSCVLIEKKIEGDMSSGYQPAKVLRGRTGGFSLIELLVVVAIILIIAAIAIPNLIKAKASANEAATVSSIHAINTAEITYQTANPTIGFSALLSDLGPGGGGYLDSVLANGTKSGYQYTYTAIGTAPCLQYSLTADPLTRGVTGNRSFFSDQTNVTRYNQTTTATNLDNAI
jgi:type IV pilus assembly protein PilA